MRWPLFPHKTTPCSLGPSLSKRILSNIIISLTLAWISSRKEVHGFTPFWVQKGILTLADSNCRGKGLRMLSGTVVCHGGCRRIWIYHTFESQDCHSFAADRLGRPRRWDHISNHFPLILIILVWHKALQIFKALHIAYYSSVSNPFLKLEGSRENGGEQSSLLGVGSSKWKNFTRRIDEISRLVGSINSTNTSVTPL